MGRVRATSTLTVPILLNEAQRASSSGHLRYAKALWDLQNEDEEKTFREFLLGVKIFMTVPEVGIHQCAQDLLSYPDHSYTAISYLYQAQLLIFYVQKNIYQDRLLRFIATVASEVNSQDRIEFMEGLLKEIVKLTNAKDHAARWRACQVIHCIMTSLPPDASISGDIAEELQTALIERLEDSKPNVRVSSIRALARLVNPDEDNADFAACSVTKAFLNLLNYEKSKEVRKAIVASLPPAPCTQSALLERTRDESDDVRRITYLAIAEKIPLESLGADNGAILISRGLTDRAPSVAEAATAMVTSWLDTAFNGEPLALLKWLDATKNPKEGEAALKSLIESSRLNAVHIGKLAAEDNLGLRANFSGSSPCDDVESKIPAIAPLMSGEEALFWRVICESLSSEAATKGLAAANTAGATANIEAAAAGDRIEALEAALPLGIQDMIDIIAVHARAGPEHRFVCAQLMALAGTCMDFTDAMGRRAAASLLEEVLLSACVDGTDNENGDAWYAATGQLLIKVHATPNELADAMLELLGTALERCGFEPSSEELWVNTLRTAALMLESLPSARPALASIAPFTFADVLNKLIQPAMLHDAEKVQEEAVRCLGLYCLLDGTPSSLANHMTLLRSCVVSTAQPLVVRTMAAKALGDLSLRHGVKVLDTFLEADEADPFHGAEPTIDMFLGVLQQWREEFADVASTTGSRSCKAARASSSSTSSTSLSPRDIEATAALGTAIVEALARLIAVNEFRQAADARRNEISAIEDSEVLRLIISLLLLNFDPATEPASRLRQCLTVFFERFSILSVTSQQYLATSLLPAARTAAADDILAGRRTATSSPLAPQVVRFMLQLLQLPVISADGKREPLGHEPLAELVMGEILGCAHNTKVPKPYLSALCKVPLALPMYDAGPETRVCRCSFTFREIMLLSLVQ